MRGIACIRRVSTGAACLSNKSWLLPWFHAWSAKFFNEKTRRKERAIAQLLSTQSHTWSARDQFVAWIAYALCIARCRALSKRGTQDKSTQECARIPCSSRLRAAREIMRQKIKHFWVRWRGAVDSEILRRFNEAATKHLCPQSIDFDTRRKRVRWIDKPLREFKPCCVLREFPRKNRLNRTCGDFLRTIWLVVRAAFQDKCPRRKRRIAHRHECRKCFEMRGECALCGAQRCSFFRGRA